MDPVNAQAKLEVRSFTRSWDNSAFQGHPRLLILVPVESAYATSY